MILFNTPASILLSFASSTPRCGRGRYSLWIVTDSHEPPDIVLNVIVHHQNRAKLKVTLRVTQSAWQLPKSAAEVSIK